MYKAAKSGYILEIQEEIQRIKTLDSKYLGFANSILDLAEEFDDEAIVKLIHICLTKFSLKITYFELFLEFWADS